MSCELTREYTVKLETILEEPVIENPKEIISYVDIISTPEYQEDERIMLLHESKCCVIS